ncbi:hypothetical protein ACVJH7_002345 [Bradyrhizobium elkanii]
MQRAGADADILRGEGVAPRGADDPARLRRVPIEARHLGVEQRVVIEIELPADPLAVREDLGRMRVFLRRHVAGLFEQRHVDHRRRVALRAGIPVPVPGAAEIAALLDDADILDPGLGQPRRSGEPGEAAADEGEGDVVGLRRALNDRRVGIVEIMRELALDLEILVVAVGTQPLVAFLLILQAQPRLVDRGGLCVSGLLGHRHRRAPRSSGS